MAHKEYRKAGTEMHTAVIIVFLLWLFLFFKYNIISDREEKRYGKRQLSVETIIINENIFTSPLE